MQTLYIEPIFLLTRAYIYILRIQYFHKNKTYTHTYTHYYIFGSERRRRRRNNATRPQLFRRVYIVNGRGARSPRLSCYFSSDVYPIALRIAYFICTPTYIYFDTIAGTFKINFLGHRDRGSQRALLRFKYHRFKPTRPILAYYIIYVLVYLCHEANANFMIVELTSQEGVYRWCIIVVWHWWRGNSRGVKIDVW